MSGKIIYVSTGACQPIAYMVKQLNYVWLTAEITVLQLQNALNTLIAPITLSISSHVGSFIITSSHSKLINTSIDTFFCELRAFLVE